jgi:cell wall-associated NlpC family hydrolase
MIRFILYIFLDFLLLVFISGCQSAIRFSNNYNVRKEVPANTFYKSSNDNSDKHNYRFEPEDNNSIIQSAEYWIGTPYQYGGDSKSGVDCSAFVQNVYSSVGINLPRTAQQQYNYILRINEEDLKPGDLIFFGKNNDVTHVAIYLGNNTIIHSSSSKGVVKQDLNSYKGYSNIVGYGRPRNQ